MKCSCLMCIAGLVLVLGCRDESVKESPPVLNVNAPRPTNSITTNVTGLTNAPDTNTPARP